MYFVPQSRNFVIPYSRGSSLPVVRVVYLKHVQNLGPEFFSMLSASLQLRSFSRDFSLDNVSVQFHLDLINYAEFL